MKFRTISLKNDILSITAWLKIEANIFFCTCVTHIIVIIWHTHHISFLRNQFSVKYRFPFPILRFLPQNHLALLKNRYLKKKLETKQEKQQNKTKPLVGSRIRVPCAIRVLEVLKVFSYGFEDPESNERGLTSGKCGELLLEGVFQNGGQNTLNRHYGA